jgi:hypothetical protein
MTKNRNLSMTYEQALAYEEALDATFTCNDGRFYAQRALINNGPRRTAEQIAKAVSNAIDGWVAARAEERGAQ